LSRFVVACIWSTFVFLGACSGTVPQPSSDPGEFNGWTRDRKGNMVPTNPYGDSIFDMSLGSTSSAEQTNGGIGVNAILWQASIETIGFMGIKSLSPETGLIVTEWFSPDGSDDEFQGVVTIFGARLSSDALTVSMSTRDGSAKSTLASERLASGLKDAILQRAREKRVSSLD